MSLCHDCRHAEAAHSIPDPEGRLCYGMGSCGNCLICEARLAGPEQRQGCPKHDRVAYGPQGVCVCS
jgi:hypothetical protein